MSFMPHGLLLAHVVGIILPINSKHLAGWLLPCNLYVEMSLGGPGIEDPLMKK